MIKNFDGAKERDTYNKVYACGKVAGYGHTQNGIRSFELLIRGTPMITRPRREDGQGEQSGNETGQQEPPVVRNTVLNVAYGNHDGELRRGSTVMIEGHIFANSYRNEIFDRWGYMQYIEADRIEPAMTEMEEVFGVRGFHYERNYVRVYLKGTIAKIIRPTTRHGWVSLSIRTSGRPRGGIGVVRAQYSTRMARVHEIGARLKEGDRVCVVGMISTTEKHDRNGIPVHYENIIIDDLQLLEAAKEIVERERDASGEGRAAAAQPVRVSGTTGEEAVQADAPVTVAPETETEAASEDTAEPKTDEAEKVSTVPERGVDEMSLRESINNTVDSLLGL